ncbi:hypothetical protein C1637_18905 [Chryseobacterium lactis]|uniref:Uncharacterized protein n=1 Tax=Chryseobacterium lactis TaxID=1241981 RepID=A0A3G6RUP1_CHRLC|nr:hypothetical protein [Chryseobacterium lactis]AZA84852.1 hypothetical protein EG342_24415 [Chryseobacterium lactis]AZB05240.1 hypothetical protein EG341_15295 [Chryseobacterium lactis]PNW12223.1 hypothetical protein C1637_18905 [Chryseobacterium lactis]
MQQPYYVIDFSASACMFEIRINDYPVIHMNATHQVSTMVPINYAILEKGKQKITASILPVVGQTEIDQQAELRFNIKLFDVVNNFVFDKQFGEYQSKPVEDKKLPVIRYESSFEAEVPYTLNAWQNGTDLKDVKDCREKLKLVYDKIIKLIQDGKYDEYKRLIAGREGNMAQSMYLSGQESEGRFKELLKEFEGMKVQPLPADAIMMQYADNKVAVLKRLNGDAALYLLDPKTGEELMLDITFYIPKGKTDFEII